MKDFGTYFSELRRRNTGLSLREWCAQHGFDPGNVSKMERGKLPPPPSSEKLEDYARALNVERGSDEWFELFDLAARARKELPSYVKDDEHLMELMPVLFRAHRIAADSGEPISPERLQQLLDILRRA